MSSGGVPRLLYIFFFIAVHYMQSMFIENLPSEMHAVPEQKCIIYKQLHWIYLL